MRKCERCGGSVVTELGYHFYPDHTRCIHCGHYTWAKFVPEKKRVERRTGRGKDNHKRQRYEREDYIKPEDWVSMGLTELAEKYGKSKSHICHMKPAELKNHYVRGAR